MVFVSGNLTIFLLPDKNCNFLLLFNKVFFVLFCASREPRQQQTSHPRYKSHKLQNDEVEAYKMFQKNNISQCDVFIQVYNFVSLVLNFFFFVMYCGLLVILLSPYLTT